MTNDSYEHLRDALGSTFEESNTDLERRVADRTKELAALNAIAATVSQSLDLAQVLNDALEKTLQVIEIEAGGIYLLDEEAGVLTVATQRGFSPQFVAEIDRLKVGEGFSGHVAQFGEPLVVRDVSADPRLTRMAVREEGLRSLAVVPLSSKGKVLGTLFAVTRGYREFTDQDVQLLTSIGHQIGVAVENARLFKAEQWRAEQFRVIAEVGRQITSTLDIDEVLVQVVRLVQQAFGYYHVGIGLIEGDEVVYRVGAGILWDDPQFQFRPARLKVGEEGITGRVAATGEPLLVPDVSREPRYIWMRGSKTRSELTVPLKAKGEIIGVLDVQSDQLDAFDESDLLVLQSLAHQAAIAIENARLYEDTKSRLAQLTALQETTRAVASTLELDRLLNLITQQATTLLQADGGILNLVDWEKNEDEAVACTGLAASLVLGRSPLEGSLSGWVTLHNQPVISNQLQNDSRVARRELARLEEEIGKQIQNAAIAPLTIKDQVMGTLVVMDKQGGRGEFDQGDLELLVAFANQTATAIENARLFAQAEQRARELEALYRAEEELNRAEEELYRRLHLNQVLQALVNVAADLLHADKSSLLVWDAQRERLVVGAARGFSPKTLSQMSFAPGEGLVGRVAVSGEPMVVEDTLTEPRVTKRITEPEGIRSFTHVPIKIGGQVFGVFTVAYAQPRAFGGDDLRLCLALAQRAALAIENARLYEQAQQVATLEERQRLARELHDSVTQALYGVTLYAEAASRLLSSGDARLAAGHLRELRDTAQEALREMRLLIFELRPPVLEKEGLVAALETRLEAVEGRAGLETEFKVEGKGRLPPQIEEGLYRIAQEALNNALKHAQAHSITVYLRWDERTVMLEIADDGIGFDPTTAREQGGLGLPGMEERATRLGGRLTVKSNPGEGTSVRVEVDR